jgi:Tfp pilus assembly protein PilF
MVEKEKYYHRAISLFAKGDTEAAITEYQEALKADPNYVDALLGIAMAYDQKGVIDEAVAHALKVVRIDPNHLLAHTSLSIFFQKCGMTKSAEQMGSVARVLSWRVEAEGKAKKVREGEGAPPEDNPFNILQ